MADDVANTVAKRKRIVAESSNFHLFGKKACDFLSCDKRLIGGVTIRISLRQSPNDFVLMSEHREKHYKKNNIENNSNKQQY